MRTALVVVPEAEPLVGRLREQYDHPAGGLSVPAHVTLLFQFGDDADGLEELFAAAEPFDFSLAHTARFAEQPIRARAESVTWLEEGPGGRWRERRRFALG